MEKSTLLAIIALLLGIASPLPIWPGPLLLRHIPPGVFSFILMLAAYFTGRKSGSKFAGMVMIVYGILAMSAGILFLTLVLVTTSRGFPTTGIIIGLGSKIALGVGILITILGYKMFKKTR